MDRLYLFTIYALQCQITLRNLSDYLDVAIINYRVIYYIFFYSKKLELGHYKDN